MVRLTVVLCAGLFVAFLIAGEDKGQKRQGLLVPVVLAEVPAPVAPPAPSPIVTPQATLTEAVFVPVQPVRSQIDSPVPVAAEPQPVVTKSADRLAVVTARSANVRSGPSTADPVVGRVTAGEEVLVVLEENATAGWSLVRIEGDGIEGYVASRLLQINP